MHSNLHLLMYLTPRSNVLLMSMRDNPHLLNSSTVIFFGEWSDSGFEYIAKKYLTDQPEDLDLKIKNPENIVQVMIEMYHDTVNESQGYYQDTDHYIYISPQLFEMFVQTFIRLY